MNEPIHPVAGVCDVTIKAGLECAPDAPPDLLFEVPHGATLAHHFTDLHARLSGDVPAELIDFFFVNTDVGAPELATAIAEQVVAARPRKKAIVVKSLLPRTLIDCNRRLEPDAMPAGSVPGQMTPGLPPWIREPADQRLLLDLHAAYRQVVEAAFAAVCGRGGLALLVHTYAPRSLEVSVDERIVEQLHAAYAPERLGQWALRAEVDLITHDPEGRQWSPEMLTARVLAELAAGAHQVVQNGTYALHPSTLAHEFSQRYPGQALCFEVRRDLLVPEFVPFRELHVDAGRVARMAAPFARAIAASTGF